VVGRMVSARDAPSPDSPTTAASALSLHRWRRLLKPLFSVFVAVGLFYFLYTRVDVEDVWDELLEMTWLELGTITLVAIWNMVAHWALWVAVTPILSFSRAATLAQSGAAVTNTLPGGSAIGVRLAYDMLASWGFAKADANLAIVISGIWNTFIRFGLPVLAVALLALQGDVEDSSRIVTGAVALALLAASITLFGLVFNKNRVAFRLGAVTESVVSRLRRLVGMSAVEGWGDATLRFRERASVLLQRRWHVITAAAIVSHLSLYLVLLVTLRHVGVSDDDLGWAQVLFVFALTRLLTTIRFTPGGAGVVEALLIGGLIAAGGDQAQVTASVVVFRGLTWLLPVPIGIVTYVLWRRHRPRQNVTVGRS
jgi:putative heme transporter